MGVHNRDYMRPSGPYRGGPGLSPVCKYLLLITVLVFVLQILIVRSPLLEDVSDYLGDDSIQEEMSPEEVAKALRLFPKVSVVQELLQLETAELAHFQLWRLLTYGFCHNRTGIFHILFNLLFLWWFGRALERIYGSWEFLSFYLAAILVAGLAYVALDLYTGDLIPMIGASGGVMGVVMLYTAHYPRERIWIWFLFPLEMRWLVLIYVIFDLHPVLLALAGDRVNSGIAHAAHLGGLGFGFLYWKTGIRLYPGCKHLLQRIPSSRKPRPAAATRKLVPQINTAFDEKRVDRILQKINEEGFDSLTEGERKILEEASRHYRERR